MASKSTPDPTLFDEYPKEQTIPNGYLYEFRDRSYRVLEMNLTGLSRLKVNLKVMNGEHFHIDTFDLYIDRARERFTQVSARRLDAQDEEIGKELYTLIDKLDQKRLELLHGRTDEKPEATMTAHEREEALAFLQTANLIDAISIDFDHCGYIGEEVPRLFGYLAAISRYLDKPLGLLIVSRSGAGKSELQDVVCKFIPNEHLRKYTRISGQSLFYQQNGSLKNCVLSIAEEKGAEDAIYSIRTLQSDQYLTVAVTITDPKTGTKRTEEYKVEGPVVIIITTTNPEALDFETRNRFVILTIDESREQTKRILRRQREQESLQGLVQTSLEEFIYRKHHNAQRLLRDIRVVNPYYNELTYPDDKLLMRREQKKYLTLIKTITFLHQYQRETKKHKSPEGQELEYIEVTIEDIALANTLAAEVLGRSLDELSPHTRTLLKQIKTMVDERSAKEKKKTNECLFSRKELCDHTGWSYWQIHAHLKQLVDMEYLILRSNSERNRYFYELVWDGQGEDGSRFISGLIDVKSLNKPVLGKKRSVLG